MSLSMYSVSVPVFTQILGAMSGVLGRAAAHCEARKIDPAALLNDRLFPDMFPMYRQVQLAVRHATEVAAKLGGGEKVDSTAVPASFAELQDLIARGLDVLDRVDVSRFEGSEDKETVFETPTRSIRFTGLGYLLSFAMPNFFFHVTTAYDILRHTGVEIGKRDFLGKTQALS